MAPAFSKEVILEGSIDHLCLVCESYLRTEREVCLHVSTAAHSQNLNSTDYVEKYRQDRIRKVKKWYFCEFCNVLVSTITAVGLHVEEPRHVENRSPQTIARVGDVITCGNVAIAEEAWHGFIDENTCTVCNVEYEDKDVHKREPTHVIKLIQSKVTDVNDSAYRKIDESTFHCLTCNEIVAEITAHLDKPKHKKILQQSIRTRTSKMEDKKNVKICNTRDQNIKLNTTSAKDDSKHASDILDAIPKFQKNNININFESCTAVCRRCSMNLEFDCKVIENHIQEHNKKKEEKDWLQRKATGITPKKPERDEKNETSDNGNLFTNPVFRTPERDIKENMQTKPTETTQSGVGDNGIQRMAEEHGLTYLPIGNQVYCQSCNKHISSSVIKITEHVNGELHKSKKPTNPKGNEIVKKVNLKKCKLRKASFYDFVNTADRVKNMLTEDMIVNDKYCIDILSFFFLTMTSPGQIRCQVCELKLHFRDIEDHLEVERHKRAILEVPVVIRSDLEFVREIRSDTFQCGYCNIYDSWEGIEDHLKSTDHKESKTFANCRLSQHLPKIMEWRLKRHLCDNILMDLLF